jgi:cytochrome b561
VEEPDEVMDGPTGRSPGEAHEGTRAVGYGRGARLFHWAIAAMVAVQIPAGIAMTSEPLEAVSGPLFILHKGLGGLLLVLIFSRLVWRLTHRPPAFPAYIPPRERRIATATHRGLYSLLVVMVVSGYVRTIGDGYPIELLDALGVPPLLPQMPRVAHVMLVVHEFTVFVLVGLVAVHVSAVLRHTLIDGNPVLSRMWPPFGSSTTDAAPHQDPLDSSDR